MEIDALMQDINKKQLKNCYVFCGADEKLIKDAIEEIISSVIDSSFRDLNLVKFDGSKVSYDDIINACETLPFMSEKKVVVIYRSSFLKDGEDRENKKKFDLISKYLDNLPSQCILLMYYVFEDDREKPGSNIRKLEKKCQVIKADKLKGERLYKKVNSLFEEKGKNLDRALLKYFCDNIENNMDMILHEVDKLVDYTLEREITKKDITDLMPNVSDDDIFDLVDFLSQKRPEKALNILNELIFKGENVISIMYMIVRQFKLLYSIKIGVEAGKDSTFLARQLKLHPYVCEKLVGQSRKFSVNQIKACMKLCLSTEKALKSSGLDKKIQMEMLIINSARVS
ncbi:DNA polymerase III subunit delta [Clostridium sp. 19966]|uniref:DNA polymerase III subunit delta n=1 Tax=Clostridium sp. 19966 TaxID=2768166 RepID=UPI0028E9FEF7|nr:DNA polymerase III subunit delta [Clostridium sp. 19966]